MEHPAKKVILHRLEELEALTDTQIIMAALSRLISTLTPQGASFDIAMGDLSLILITSIRAGGNKEEAIKYLLGMLDEPIEKSAINPEPKK